MAGNFNAVPQCDKAYTLCIAHFFRNSTSLPRELIYSNGTTLHIDFKSDYSETRTGFLVAYALIEAIWSSTIIAWDVYSIGSLVATYRGGLHNSERVEIAAVPDKTRKNMQFLIYSLSCVLQTNKSLRLLLTRFQKHLQVPINAQFWAWKSKYQIINKSLNQKWIVMNDVAQFACVWQSETALRW